MVPNLHPGRTCFVRLEKTRDSAAMLKENICRRGLCLQSSTKKRVLGKETKRILGLSFETIHALVSSRKVGPWFLQSPDSGSRMIQNVMLKTNKKGTMGNPVAITIWEIYQFRCFRGTSAPPEVGDPCCSPAHEDLRMSFAYPPSNKRGSALPPFPENGQSSSGATEQV